MPAAMDMAHRMLIQILTKTAMRMDTAPEMHVLSIMKAADMEETGEVITDGITDKR